MDMSGETRMIPQDSAALPMVLSTCILYKMWHPC